MVKVKKDLTGMVFGRLTVLQQAEDYIAPNGRHSAQWLCECSCEEHNQVIVYASSLKNGTTTSCGCFAKEQSGKRIKHMASESNKRYKHKTNIYDLSGDYGIGWTTNTNKEFYFDIEDYDKIKNYCWVEHILKNNYHALEAHVPDSNKNIRMHWIVVGKGYDHENRNPLDNRKCNLRIATQQENCQNISTPTNNTTGFIGVYWNKQNKKWTASIRINNKQKYLGSFIDKTEAIKARLNAELKYYGEFAPQRHLFQEYEINILKEGRI